MSRKEYTSPEYFAQRFTEFLRKPQASFPAEHHRNLVRFSMFKKEYSLEFLKVSNKKSSVILEEKIEGEYIFVKSVSVKVDRSKSGKISNVYFSNLLKRLFKNDSIDSK